MYIKSEADKIGSRIEDYLDGLDNVLERKLQSMFGLKEKIQEMRSHIEDSKMVEKRYFECSRALNILDEN
jgi:archaellum component FlaC